MDVYEFDCKANNSPAYSCNKPGDNSGEYVRIEDAKALERKIEILKLMVENGLGPEDMKNDITYPGSV